MNVHKYLLPIRNSGKLLLKIEFEPEGNWFPLQPGESCEIRLFMDSSQHFDLEIEFEDELILVHCSARKEFWKNGQEQ